VFGRVDFHAGQVRYSNTISSIWTLFESGYGKNCGCWGGGSETTESQIFPVEAGSRTVTS
jgi:hypothetical protein